MSKARVVITPENMKTEGNQVSLPPCEKKDCHAWQDGKCTALSDNRFGSRPCPFYKKLDVCRQERSECLDKLIRSGRMDVVEKYKSVLAELGIFGLADKFIDRAAEALERYSEECMRELLAGVRDMPEDCGSQDMPGSPGEGEDWDD